MEIKISYSKIQLEKAVNFIARYNSYQKGEYEKIRHSILDSIQRIAIDPETIYTGTMGYMLIADREFEDLNNDENTCRIEITVDPALGCDDRWFDDNYHEEVITVPAKEFWKKPDE
jgi:hypothetical protein